MDRRILTTLVFFTGLTACFDAASDADLNPGKCGVALSTLPPEHSGLEEPKTHTPLPLAVDQFAVAANYTHIYLLGGATRELSGSNEDQTVRTTLSDKIFVAPLDEEGDFGEWVEVGTLPTPLRLHRAVIVDDTLFVIGGFDYTNQAVNLDPLTTGPGGVWAAAIRSDGSLSDWQNWGESAALSWYSRVEVRARQLVSFDGTAILIGTIEYDTQTIRWDRMSSPHAQSEPLGFAFLGVVPFTLIEDRAVVGNNDGLLYATAVGDKAQSWRAIAQLSPEDYGVIGAAFHGFCDSIAMVSTGRSQIYLFRLTEDFGLDPTPRTASYFSMVFNSTSFVAPNGRLYVLGGNTGVDPAYLRDVWSIRRAQAL